MLQEKQKLPFDAIIGHDLMIELQMTYGCSLLRIWDGVRLTMQKIQNGIWKDRTLTDQEDPESTKEKFIWIGIILDANYKKTDLEQEVNKIFHLTTFQQVILLSCLKLYENIFGDNLGEWNEPPVNIPIKYNYKPYHARCFPILVICLED